MLTAKLTAKSCTSTATLQLPPTGIASYRPIYVGLAFSDYE